MRAELEPLKRITPQIPCTTNMMGLYDGLNYFRLSEALDVASWDNYPLWRGDESDANLAAETAMVHDLNRCLKGGRPFMLMESSPSATNWQPVAKLRRPGGHLLYSLQAVAHGSDTVQYFQYRKSRGSSEKLHGAVIDQSAMKTRAFFREVAETGELLARLDELVGTRDRPRWRWSTHREPLGARGRPGLQAGQKVRADAVRPLPAVLADGRHGRRNRLDRGTLPPTNW
jgi:beta-galactosidase